MATVKVAAVQAAYVLMDQKACVAKAVDLLRRAAAEGAGLVVFPEVFIPGTPIWIEADRSGTATSEWYALLVDQAVVVPGPVTAALGAAARDAGVYVVIGVEEREPHGEHHLQHHPLLRTRRRAARHAPQAHADRLRAHRVGHGGRLNPAGDRHPARPAVRVDLLGELHAAGPVLPVRQGVDIWAAPTLAAGDGWIASMRHIAREGRCYVIGVNPCLHVDQIQADFPHRDQVWRTEQGDDGWVEPGNSVIVDPNGELLAGPARHEETILTADLDLDAVRAARRKFDPVGHYNRPDVFRLTVDNRPRVPFVLDDI